MTDETRYTCIESMVAVARHHGVDLSADQIIHDNALKAECSPAQLVKIARSVGLKARHFKSNWRKLQKLGDALPALVTLVNGRCVIIVGFDEDDRIIVQDPLEPPERPLLLDKKTFRKQWRGHVILLKRRYTRNDEARHFSLSWFIPEIWRQRKAFRKVVVAAMFLNLLALVIPVFFQIVIDKVLVHNTIATLQVLAAGVIIAILFEAVLSYLRTYILLYANRKIDIRLTTQTYNHLLSLPATFFNRSTAGVLSKHMQQTEQIREFLTGKALSTFLDLSVMFVFLPFLWFYSQTLTFIVLGFGLLMALFIGALLQPFRKRLHDLYQAEGDRQALLVESITGAATIKALALEPRQRVEWESLSASTVKKTFRVGRIALVANTVSHMLEQLMSVAIISTGVYLVINKFMTVGELIAFQMLANRVSSPLVQFISLIHEYQETGLAIRMLGNVMNARPERSSITRAIRPEKLKGEVMFRDVYFKYPDAPEYALQGINLNFRSGEKIGIVGRSGSGKTTLARMIQVLHPVQSGAVRLDDIDVREFDLGYLRSNIGVVLQDSFLFRGSIRENISRTRPDATIEEIVAAARVAGAHEFIQDDLPLKYDTLLEEGAVNLSGGQRQRLSIARALLRNPQVLIFDEATSSLDPDSEYAIQQNMKQIAQGRTLIIISHRLSMVRNADKIVVMEKGRVDDFASHDVLLERNEIYKNLWNRQMNTGDGDL